MERPEGTGSARGRLLAAALLGVGLLLLVTLLWQATVAGRLIAGSIALLTGPAYLLAYPLLYLEESGIPMPLPGDVFVMYVGHRLDGQPVTWVAAWLGFVLAVTLGATNLYWVSRRLGRHIVVGRLGALLHLTPKRMARAEAWFQHWGLVAVIFGRHLPGGRIPITVAAGVLEMRYSTFAFGVMASAAVWAAFFLAVGAVFGGKLARILQLHQDLTYLVVPVAAFGITAYAAYRVVAWRRAQRSTAGAESQA